jgi:hypothetical protein
MVVNSSQEEGGELGVWLRVRILNGTHAERSRFIRSSAHYGAIPAPRDGDGFASDLRVMPLLYGRIKGVHIDMHDLADSHAATILFRSSRRGRPKVGYC